MKKTIKVLFSFLCAWWLWSTVALPCQAQMITIGILPFQDESGANVPPALLQKICQEFKLKMTLAYKDVLARLVSAESLGAPANAGIEQLAAFGKQQGVKFVLRGGILAVVSEKVGNDLKCQLELFSELIDTDSSTVSSLRAEGEGLETNSATDDARRWESYNWNSPAFAQAALGQALNAALGNLADQVHASAVTPAAPPPGQTQPPVETAATATQTQPPPAAAPAADPYQMDQELQQLIAQAESLLSSGSAANMGDITPLQQSLEGLKTAMNNKLNLMQQAQDTTAIDQEILQRKQDLQNLVSAYTQQAASAPPPSADAQQFSGEKKDLISKINDLLGNTLNTILKIQEMRTALSSSNQAQGAVPPPPTDTGTGQPPVDTSAGQQPPPPTEEQTSSVSGVVTDNGNPVEGATVTDPQSGASATTDSNGSYTIAHLPSDRIANLQVVKDGLQIATGKVELQPGQSGISDWTLKTGSQGPTGLSSSVSRIMPSSMIAGGKTGQASEGTIQGVVRDGQGQPVPRALVSVKGVGMVRTDSQGRYTFANIPQGSYQVVVQQGGAAAQTQQVNLAGGHPVQTQMLYKAKSPSAGTTLRTQILIPGENTILKGRVVDENDEVLSSAKVTAVYAGGALDVYSDNTGMYEIHNLKQGTYRVLASKAGYNETSQNVNLQRNKASTQNFKLKKSSSPFIRQAIASQKQKQAALPSPGRTITKPGRTVSLPSRSLSTSSAPGESKTGQKSKLDILKTLDKIKTPITSGPLKTPLGSTRMQTPLGNGSVRGTVKDSKSGGPVSGASVSLRGKSSTQTNGSGQFSFSDLAPGVYAVTIRKSGYMDGGGSVTIKPGQTTNANFRLTLLVSPKQLPSVIRRLKLPEPRCGQ